MATTKAARPTRPVPTTKSALAERFKDYPAVDVLERRLEDPRDVGSLPILLNDEPRVCCQNSEHWVKYADRIEDGAVKCPGCKLPFRNWYVRWVNGAEEGRWSTIKARGYIRIEIRELPDSDEIATLYGSEKDTFVRRGDRGQEVLCKIPFAYFITFQKKKEALRKRRATAKAVHSQIAEEAGSQLGSEAGDFVHDELRVTEYKRHRPRPLSEELEGSPQSDE